MFNLKQYIMENFVKLIQSFEDKMTMEELQLVTDHITNYDDSYSLISWPESQEYMEKNWFQDEAILDVSCSVGSSAYFIPNKYLN